MAVIRDLRRYCGCGVEIEGKGRQRCDECREAAEALYKIRRDHKARIARLSERDLLVRTCLELEYIRFELCGPQGFPRFVD